jgi:uncharacterized membrane protein (UPF0182 family)
VSVTLALFAGWLGTNRWELVLKALNPTPFDIRDPLFDQDVAFYVFRLPLWTSLYGWLMGVLVVSGLAVIAVYFCTRGIQVSPGAVSISRRARGHLLGLAALLLLLKAAGTGWPCSTSSSPYGVWPSAPGIPTSTPSSPS